MENSHFVSIIIPIYKVELFLRDCVDSVRNQSLQNIQIILVDDGSPDHCGEICDEYAMHDNRITVIHQRNQGLSAARNAGIAIAQADYLMFIDSDDCIAPDMAECLYTIAKDTGADVVACAHAQMKENEQLLDVWKPSNEITQPQIFTREQALVEHLITNSIDVIACNKLYKRCLFGELRYPIGLLYEDMLTTYRVLKQTEKVAFIPEVKYYYRKRCGSIGDAEFSVQWYDLISALNMAYAEAKKNAESLTELETAYALWRMVVVNKIILSRQTQEQMWYLKETQAAVKKRQNLIKNATSISRTRKIELLLFSACPCVYGYLYKQYKKHMG
ncbi:MAG: glycosyltransferase family 2 protein [Oscillospiraceae bacterium]